MTTILNTYLEPLPACERSEIPADSLDMKGAILAPGLMLSEESDRALSLYTLNGGRASKLGTFGTAADALSALDEIDLAEADELAA